MTLLTRLPMTARPAPPLPVAESPAEQAPLGPGEPLLSPPSAPLSAPLAG